MKYFSPGKLDFCSLVSPLVLKAPSLESHLALVRGYNSGYRRKRGEVRGDVVKLENRSPAPRNEAMNMSQMSETFQ